jgi:lysozyme
MRSIFNITGGTRRIKGAVKMDKFRLVKTLIQHEGLVLRPYQDQEGFLTIGVGHNLDANGISEKVAMFMLDEDIDEHVQALRHFAWFENLSDVRQEVIINLHFNIGHKSFLQFRKMIWNLEKGDFDQAANEMTDSKWYNQVGPRAVFLVNAMRANKF